MAGENGDAPPPAQGAGGRDARRRSGESGPLSDYSDNRGGEGYDGADRRSPYAATPDLRRSIGRAPRPRSASVGLETFC